MRFNWDKTSLVILSISAALFLTIQVSLFGSWHISTDNVESEAEQEYKCNRYFRSIISENGELRDRVLELEWEVQNLTSHLIALEAEPITVRQLGPGGRPLTPGGTIKLKDTIQEEKGKIPPTVIVHQEAQIFAGASAESAVAAVVVMTCNRPQYLQRTLDSIFKVNPNPKAFPVFVSQDGMDPRVKSLVLGLAPNVGYLQHIEDMPPKMKTPGENIVYYRIAEHYKWALQQLFDVRNFSRVIILEDDMDLSPDFFQYFGSVASLLDSDPSLWCASSWNDNGQTEFVSDATQLYRSDFFPGLGWMLVKRVWEELRPIWTTGPPEVPGIFGGYWDDWMRLNEVRKGRQCIRPEVCRTFNFGEVGSSRGQFFKQYLGKIKLNDQLVDWASMDLRYLEKRKYVDQFAARLVVADKVADVQHARLAQRGDVVVQYDSRPHFEQLANSFGVMSEWKEGVPRGSYQGVVTFRIKGGAVRVFLAPGPSINLHAHGYIIPPNGGRP